MNKRQKRLCRALLDFYDANGAKPYPLAQLAKKTGCDASDIYDKDSQSGDLWPFDAKARGNYAGMLSFSSGKNTAVTITSAGLIELEKLCGDDGAAVIAPPIEVRKHAVEQAPAPVAPAPAPALRKASVATAPAIAPKAPPPNKQFTWEDVANARLEFSLWLGSDPAGKALLGRLEGKELIEAALEKFFDEFLQGKEV